MPDAADFHVGLLASRRAVSVRAAALLLAPSPLRAAATLGSVAALALAFCPRRASNARQLVIGVDGAIRAGGGNDAEAAAVRCFGPRFVCLQTQRGSLAVWPDSMTGPPAGDVSLSPAAGNARPEPTGARAAVGSRTK